MKKFVFSMSHLLDAKMAFEEAAERRLADGLRCLQAAREELERITAMLNRESGALAAIGGRHTSRSELLAHVRYRHALEQMMRKQALLVGKYEATVNDLREKLREAMAERQSLENLKRVEYRKWAVEARRQEQKELDELSVQRFLRRPSEALVTAG